MFKKIAISLAALAAALMTLVTNPERARAAWPDRPLTIIVPWGAGGAADQLSRALAPMLEKDLGVPVNVVLRPGGSGAVGHTAIAQAAPDGYTWGLATVEITMMHWQGLAPIQPKDFTMVSIINADAGGLIVRTESPYKSAKELLDDIKAKPAGTFKASGTGQGGIWHLGLVGWLLAEKVDPKKVPWVPNQGAGPSMQDLVAGGVDFVTASLPEGRALIDGGKARALAQMDNKRLALYPNVPTLKEGAGSDWTILTWRGVLGPAGIPADITPKMIASVKKAFDSPEFQDFMKNRGFGVTWMPGAEGTAFINKANDDFGRIMKEAGLAK
jgi:tripartite-type tricarboxylate transporter receptor subunit TctC